MSKVTLYSLEFVIDGTQVSLDDLKKRAAKAMHTHGLNVDWQVTQTASQHLKLFIRGSLEDVDTCHLRFNDELISQYSCIRLRDEAGDKIRQRAYPVLARIEQQLRTFINRAMTEVKGFDWWESITPALTPQRIREDVQKVEDRIGKAASTIHHPLELASFDHLLAMVTGSVQQWPEHKPLYASDLLEILSDCSSIEDIQEKLAEKTRKISLWDEVFARYFKTVDQWKELEETITGFVIDVRNKVMHHRPMHLWELRKLQETEQRADALLASARKELSEEQRIEARQVSEEWARAWSRTIAELAPPPRLSAADLMEPFLKQQEEFSRAISEQIGRTVQQIAELAPPPKLLAADLMEPFLKQQEEFSRAISEQIGWTVQQIAELAPPPRLLTADLMEPFLKQQEFSRTIGEQIRRTVQQIAELAPLPRLSTTDLMKPFLEQQEKLSHTFREQMARATQQMMESLRDQQEQIAQAAQQTVQLSASDTSYVGSKDSVRFHLLACTHARRILPENLIQFAARDEAVAKGYMPCGTCKP